MAWNPSPEVAVARDAAQRLGSLAKDRTERCIVFYELQDGRFGYASYGRTPTLCQDARRLAEQIFKFCMGETLNNPLAHFECPECMAIADWLAERDGLEDGEAPLSEKVKHLVNALVTQVVKPATPADVQDTINAATVLMP